MKKIEKLFIDLSKLIPEMKEEPVSWKKFLKKWIEKKPNSQMSPAFEERLHQRILQAIVEKNRKKAIIPPSIFWKNGFKLFYSLAGVFAVFLLVGLPLFHSKPFPMVLIPVKMDQGAEKMPVNEVQNNEENTKTVMEKSDPSELSQSVKTHSQSKNYSDVNLVNKIENEAVPEQKIAPVTDAPLEPKEIQIDPDLAQGIEGVGGGSSFSSSNSSYEPLPDLLLPNDTLSTFEPNASNPPTTSTPTTSTPTPTTSTPPTIREPIPEVAEPELPPAQPVNLTQFVPQIITLARNFLVSQNIDLSRFTPPYLATSLQSPTLLQNALVVFTSFDPTKKNLTIQVNFEAGTVNFR